MQINSAVIHEIIKEANTMQAEVFLTDELLDIDNEEIKRILTSLEKSFTKHTPKRAKFLDEGFKDVINDFSNFSILKISKPRQNQWGQTRLNMIFFAFTLKLA